MFDAKNTTSLHGRRGSTCIAWLDSSRNNNNQWITSPLTWGQRWRAPTSLIVTEKDEAVGHLKEIILLLNSPFSVGLQRGGSGIPFSIRIWISYPLNGHRYPTASTRSFFTLTDTHNKYIKSNSLAHLHEKTFRIKIRFHFDPWIQIFFTNLRRTTLLLIICHNHYTSNVCHPFICKRWDIDTIVGTW